MRLIIFLTLVMTISACGKRSSNPQPPSKSLFSLWTDKADSSNQIDLSGLDFGNWTSSFDNVASTADVKCQLRIIITGDQSAGNVIFRVDQLGGGAPECDTGAEQYDYTKTGTELRACERLDPTTCYTFY